MEGLGGIRFEPQGPLGRTGLPSLPVGLYITGWGSLNQVSTTKD